VRNRLGVLIGTTPDAVAMLMPSAIPVPIAGLAMVAPADLVRRRPDLRLRERQVAAAVARSGIAEAELYPRLSLSGSFAYESTRASDLFDSASRAWSIGPSIRVPLFNRGRLKQQVAVQDARAEQAVAAYEHAVLQAYADVENALASLARQGERAAQLDRQVAALASALELAEQRHQEGLDSYLAVIDARTRLVDARDVRAQARLDAARQLVALAAALGGGWEAPAPRP
nr:TolC family protein [Planctomycetota bacterium]